jgi:hypothetical protein
MKCCLNGSFRSIGYFGTGQTVGGHSTGPGSGFRGATGRGAGVFGLTGAGGGAFLGGASGAGAPGASRTGIFNNSKLITPPTKKSYKPRRSRCSARISKPNCSAFDQNLSIQTSSASAEISGPKLYRPSGVRSSSSWLSK